jgi:GntR family transcriptional regulator/MocR family aminotransferase
MTLSLPLPHLEKRHPNINQNMLHIQLDKTRYHCPYYLQLVEQIRQAILSGKVTTDTYLPPTRQLANELGVARHTVVLAYEELCAQGYCTSYIGKGTVVTPMPVLQGEPKQVNHRGLPEWVRTEGHTKRPSINDLPKICFTPGLAQVEQLPLKAMSRAFQSVIHDAPIKFKDYGKSNGHPALIRAICKHILPARGIKAEPDQVLITNGSQHSSSLLSALFAPYGGKISYGVPGYLAIPKNFTSRGIIGISCPMDEEGIVLTQEARSAQLHYVMPEHHFPTGVTLSPNRRATLLQLAEERDALIIEDDYDSEFYYDRHPLPALKAEKSGGRVIYLGTFSKILFNGLRLGYIVAHPEIIQGLVDLHWQLDGGTSIVLQLWIAELLESGAVARHLRRMRVYYRKKRDLIASYLRDIFPCWKWRQPNGGIQFWVELPPNKLAETVVKLMAEKGVGLCSGADYYEQKSDEAAHSLILGFGSVTESEIHQAFKRMSEKS